MWVASLDGMTSKLMPQYIGIAVQAFFSGMSLSARAKRRMDQRDPHKAGFLRRHDAMRGISQEMQRELRRPWDDLLMA